MANLAAIIANRGFYYNPNIVLEIGNEKVPESDINQLNIASEHFDYVINAMEEVVRSGSARRGFKKV